MSSVDTGREGSCARNPAFEELESFCKSRMGYQEGMQLLMGTPAVSAGYPKAGREQKFSLRFAMGSAGGSALGTLRIFAIITRGQIWRTG
jgi:hypothetical protein